MSLTIYNDLTRKREEFKPIEPGKVRFYTCGPTVYDYFHIGNARPFVFFDVARRYLESLGYDVTFVQNFTDIDDKMINRANERGISVAELAEEFINAYYKDADALGIKRATVNPRATHEIDTIISLIQKLVDKGHAYPMDGSVYFDVLSDPEYGELSKQSVDELQSGARIDIDEKKKQPLDFALWKAAKPDEPAWDRPWGPGRPGWHIECSAMSTKYLGETIDIHGGGSDLIFPHHENEIAQSQCASGKQFVKYWMHNAYLLIDKEKMSKSLGNFMTVRDIRKKYNPLVLRYFLLSAQYRSPINFTAEALDQAKSALERITNCYNDLIFAIENRKSGGDDAVFMQSLADAKTTYTECMDDDFNTAGAIGGIFDAVWAANVHLNEHEEIDIETAKKAVAFFDAVNNVLGFFPAQNVCIGEETAEIEKLIAERASARKAKDFKRSDDIRDELVARGIIIEDTPQGTRWKKQI